MKRFLIGAASGALILSSMATAAFAAQPSGAGLNAPDSAQCGSGASSGAFNFQNSVYGEGDNGINGDSSSFGKAGGAPALHDGAVGQQDGATGSNNSAVCGNTP